MDDHGVVGSRPARSGARRSKRPTMQDVADHVGVSRPLVSLILRNAPGPSAETRERVLQAAQELGYHPDTAASVLRRNRSRHLGVLFTMQHPFDVELVENIYPVAEQLGYTVVLGALLRTRNEQAAIQELLGYHSEALILIGGHADTRELAAVISQVPIVEIGRKVNDTAIDVVRTDGARGVRDAVGHLVALGHRDIVHVDGGDLPAAPERRHGYQTAMRKHDLHEKIRILPGDYTEESGVRAAQTLLAEDSLPTAVVAGNDECALGLIESLIREGIDVPGDVSVVGFDDSRLARLSFLNLTTIQQDSAQMAEAAVNSATRRLEDETAAARHIVLPPTLIVRQTTGPVRSQDEMTA